MDDKELQKKVAERIKGQIPSALLGEPIGISAGMSEHPMENSPVLLP